MDKEFLVVLVYRIKKGQRVRKGLVKAKDRAAVNAYIRRKYGERLIEVVSVKPRPGWMDYVKEEYI